MQNFGSFQKPYKIYAISIQEKMFHFYCASIAEIEAETPNEIRKSVYRLNVFSDVWYKQDVNLVCYTFNYNYFIGTIVSITSNIVVKNYDILAILF